MMNTKLYVGNLSARVTEEGLRFLFSRKGAITAIEVVIQRITGRSRAFAIVTMATPEGAEAARFGLHGQIWNGRHITVNTVKEPPDQEEVSAEAEPMRSRLSVAAQQTISPFFPIKGNTGSSQ
jgi:RNA recognition motif-containing protein